MNTILMLSAIAGVANAEVLSLTPDNWDSATAGKTVFIKFFAPWCGHCKAMAADWEALAEEFEGDSTALIAEVDCTADDTDDICEENGVQGFPTLKYGDPAGLDDYQGGRDFDSLVEFAKENLKPSCSPTNIDLCDGEQKEKIESYLAMSADELSELISKVDLIVAEADQELDEGIEGLQNMYESMMQQHDDKIKQTKKDADYKTLKAVLGSKKSGSDEL